MADAHRNKLIALREERTDDDDDEDYEDDDEFPELEPLDVRITRWVSQRGTSGTSLNNIEEAPMPPNGMRVSFNLGGITRYIEIDADGSVEVNDVPHSTHMSKCETSLMAPKGRQRVRVGAPVGTSLGWATPAPETIKG